MDLPVTPQPQPTGASPPGATASARGAGTPDADQPDTTFADLLAAGLSGGARDVALPPAGATSAKTGGPLAEPDEPATPPPAADDPTAMLLLAAFGASPIVTTAPVAAAPPLDQTQSEGDDAKLPASNRRGQPALLPVFGESAGPRTGAAIAADAADAPREHAGSAHELIDQSATESPFTANAALVDARPPATAAHHAPATAELRTPINVSGWDAGLGKTLVWMAQGKHALAELRLNPPELGPLKIVIALGGDDGREARVAFASPHAAVRDAIEAAMPRLREMMADSGISLGQTAVSAESFQRPDQPERFRPRGAPSGEPGDTDAGPHPVQAVPAVRAGIGIVDIFA